MYSRTHLHVHTHPSASIHHTHTLSPSLSIVNMVFWYRIEVLFWTVGPRAGCKKVLIISYSITLSDQIKKSYGEHNALPLPWSFKHKQPLDYKVNEWTQRHTCMHTHTHACMHARMHTHTRTHTKTEEKKPSTLVLQRRVVHCGWSRPEGRVCPTRDTPAWCWCPPPVAHPAASERRRVGCGLGAGPVLVPWGAVPEAEGVRTLAGGPSLGQTAPRVWVSLKHNQMVC